MTVNPLSPYRKKQLTEITDRREQVAQMHLQRYNQNDIAKMLGVSVGTISEDLKAIRDEWRRRYAENYEIARARHHEELDKEQRILEDQRDMVMSAPQPPTNAQFDRLMQINDRIVRIMQERAKIDGLYAPTKAQVDVEVSDNFSQEYREKLARKILENAANTIEGTYREVENGDND